MKICSKCGKEYPATTEYFYKNSYYPDGLAKSCKQCDLLRMKIARDSKNKEKYEKQAKIKAELKQKGTRICTKCGKELPATPEYFYRDARNEDGLRCECKQCQQALYAVYYENKNKEEKEQKQKIEQDLKQRGKKICSLCKQELDANLDNFYISKTSKDGLSTWCKSCNKQHGIKYRNEHYDEYIKKSRIRNKQLQQNSEYTAKRSEYDKQYYQQNKERKAKYSRIYYAQKDKESILNYQREYKKKNKKIVDLKAKAYREQNAEKLRIYDKQRYEKNRLNRLFSSAISHSLKGTKAGRHWEDLVPYTLEQLRQHIESQFTPPMSWDNYGTYWELDHIIPQNLFNFDSSEDRDFQICWSLANLRPLEKSLNRQRPKDGSDISEELKVKIYSML